MRETTVLDWWAVAFVVLLLVFAFQPLMWIRTIKWLSDAIDWCRAVEIRWDAARNRAGWGLGVTYDRWDDLSCRLFSIEHRKFVTWRVIHRMWTFQALFWNLVICSRSKRGGE